MALEDFQDNPLESIANNTSELFSGFWESLPEKIMTQLDFLFFLIRIVLILTIAYFAILILIHLLKFIFGSGETRILRKINNNLEEIIAILKGGRESKHAKEKEREKKK